MRTEELVNYFSFDEPVEFNGDSPFAIYTEVGPSPFDEDKALAFVRVKTQELEKQDLPASNLTFLIDTSGSMSSHDKLPLLKEAFGLLVDALDDDDTVSIVTYAGSSGVALDSASGGDKAEIMQVINGLRASGSTAGGNGILTAYELAEENFVEGGNNRIILASDGDFNVGISDLDELQELISAKRESGVYLSVLGFGTGNIRDDIMETLAAHGNGNYSYINSASTANKVLVEEMGSNFFTIADDVKAQVEFNPANVAGYRLIGYENRQMDNRDFANDAKDAGEIGVGTDVVALFELELAGSAADQKYAGDGAVYGDELFEVRIRYKNPGETESNLIEHPVTVDRITGDNTSDFRFASSVAALGEVLRGSEFAGELTISDITAMARGSLGEDPGGYRLDHLLLLRQCEELLG